MARKTVEGVVEAVSKRTGKSSKGGNWVAKSFMVDGEWFGGYVDAENKAAVSKASEGDTIKMIVEKNAKGYWNYADKFKILAEGVKVATGDGTDASLKAFVREYGSSLGKASGIVAALVGAGKVNGPAKAYDATVKLGRQFMEEVWFATPESLGLVQEPVEEEEVEESDQDFDDSEEDLDEDF